MFETLSDFIVQSIQLLLKTKTEPQTSMYVKFLNLFDSLFEVENTSKAAYKEVKGYADGTEVPTKVVLRAKLYKLFTACQKFLKNLNDMSSLLALYNEELFKFLGGILYTKSYNLELIDIFLEACPSESTAPFLVNYPSSFPINVFSDYQINVQLTKSVENLLINNDHSKIEDLIKTLKSKVSKKTVDLRIINQNNLALKNAEQNIKSIESARQQLAEFIQTNFPLNKIFKSDNTYTEMNFHAPVTSVVGNVAGDNQQNNRADNSNLNLSNAQFGGGLVNADTVTAGQIGGNITNYSTEQRQNLAEAAAEIQQLLNQLSQTYPTATTSEKMSVVAKAVDEIENNPTLKVRVIGALKAGGTEVFKELIDHPLVNILLASIEGWQEAE